MNTRELHAIQGPLKEQYRAAPEAALITLTAHGSLDDQQVACRVETGRALALAGLHPATGGDGSTLCSGDMLLQALVACAGVTLQAVAVNRGMEVSGSVLAEGDLDVRGTLGTDRDVPVGFREIRLRFELESDVSREELAKLVATTERYCVVLQTLIGTPNVRTTLTAA